MRNASDSGPHWKDYGIAEYFPCPGMIEWMTKGLAKSLERTSVTDTTSINERLQSNASEEVNGIIGRQPGGVQVSK
jgi:hypothetical protein